MAREVINVGAAPNDGLGDPIRTSFIKTNNNFDELYARAQENPPATLVGSPGDVAGMYAYDTTYFYYCYQDWDGTSTVWARITNDALLSISRISNGNSTVNIPTANSNVSVTVANVANVAVFTASGAVINGDLTVTGNANLSGNIIGDRIVNGSTAIEIPSASGNASVTVANVANVVVFTSQGPVFPTGSRIRGDFSSGLLGDRVVFQTISNFTNAPTLVSAIPGPNNTANVTSGFSTFSTADPVNSSIFGVFSYANLGAVRSLSTGNANVTPIAIMFTDTEVARWTTGGNLGLGNSSPTHRLAVSGNAYVTENLTVWGNVTGGNVNSLGLVSVIGNVQAGNLRTAGLISATGNVTGARVFTTGGAMLVQTDLGGLGYGTGAGGTVTQGAGSGKATAVTLNKPVGRITMDAASLNADTTVSFTFTNSLIAATDVMVLNHASGGTAGAYTLNAQCAAGSAVINVRNVSTGALGEAIVLQYALVKGVIA